MLVCILVAQAPAHSKFPGSPAPRPPPGRDRCIARAKVGGSCCHVLVPRLPPNYSLSRSPCSSETSVPSEDLLPEPGVLPRSNPGSNETEDGC